VSQWNHLQIEVPVTGLPNMSQLYILWVRVWHIEKQYCDRLAYYACVALWEFRNLFVDCGIYILFVGVQRIYQLNEAHEIFVTGLEFAPNTTSRAIVGPNVDFTLFSISADSQIKAHQVESRRTLFFFVTMCISVISRSKYIPVVCCEQIRGAYFIMLGLTPTQAIWSNGNSPKIRME